MEKVNCYPIGAQPHQRPSDGMFCFEQLRADRWERSNFVTLTGEIIPIVRESHKSSDFIDFLKILDEKYDNEKKIKIIFDNHSAHTSKETRRYLEQHPGRFEFVFTPKHGS